MKKVRKNKINILFVLPNFDTGGSEKLVVDIIERLDRTRFNPVMCVFFTGHYEAKMKDLDVPLYVIHKDDCIRSKWSTARFISQIIRRHHIDVVNTHHSSPLIQGVLPFKIFNKVMWAHTEHTRLDLDPNINPKILAMIKVCLRFVDVCVGISDGVCDYFHNELKVPSGKIKKIYNGVDVKRFCFDAAEARRLRKSYRKQLAIADDDVVIGMFANFRQQKNHQCLIKAVHHLRAHETDGFCVVLAGDGPERKNIESEIERLHVDDRIKLIGMRSDIPELMNMIDIYCLPSHFEGLPFSLIEAAIAGKEVVASEVIGNVDVVKAMGRGQLVEPDDPVGLARVLKSLFKAIRLSSTDDDWQPDERLTVDGMMQRYETLFAEGGMQ